MGGGAYRLQVFKYIHEGINQTLTSINSIGLRDKMESTEENGRADAGVNGAGDPQAVRRLPCRGCTTRCGLYETCDGRPWRMDSSSRTGPVLKARGS